MKRSKTIRVSYGALIGWMSMTLGIGAAKLDFPLFIFIGLLLAIVMFTVTGLNIYPTTEINPFIDRPGYKRSGVRFPDMLYLFIIMFVVTSPFICLIDNAYTIISSKTRSWFFWKGFVVFGLSLLGCTAGVLYKRLGRKIVDKIKETRPKYPLPPTPHN